jgi:hypothetical protein
MITGMKKHFMFHIPWIYILRFLYFIIIIIILQLSVWLLTQHTTIMDVVNSVKLSSARCALAANNVLKDVDRVSRHLLWLGMF